MTPEELDKLDEFLCGINVPYVLIFQDGPQSGVRSNLEDTEDVINLVEVGTETIHTGKMTEMKPN